MKARIIVRLVIHVLVLLGLIGFFAMFPVMLPRYLLIRGCSANADGCLGPAGFWAVLIAGMALLVMDLRMLRTSAELEAVLLCSLATELLLPAGWYATMLAMHGSDLVGPAWLILLGPVIMLSALASAVEAWLMVKDGLQAAVSSASVTVTGAIALVLSFMGGALAYLFAGLVLSQF